MVCRLPCIQLQVVIACCAASQPEEQLDVTLCAVLPDLVLACPCLCPAHVWLWENAWLVRRLQSHACLVRGAVELAAGNDTKVANSTGPVQENTPCSCSGAAKNAH